MGRLIFTESKHKKILYIVSLLIVAVLFSALFINVKSSKLLTAALLIPLTLLVKLTRTSSAPLALAKLMQCLAAFISFSVIMIVESYDCHSPPTIRLLTSIVGIPHETGTLCSLPQVHVPLSILRSLPTATISARA